VVSVSESRADIQAREFFKNLEINRCNMDGGMPARWAAYGLFSLVNDDLAALPLEVDGGGKAGWAGPDNMNLFAHNDRYSLSL
jgi:hypothetical protein